MNINNHLLLDEFLEGRLTPTERKKFLTKLESDADLRRLVEAERVIKQSVISDRQGLDSIDHSATYSFLIAGLAATAVTVAGSSTATAAVKTTTTKSITSSLLGGGSKSAILSLTVSIVASAAIGVATYQLRQSSTQVDPTASTHSSKPTPTPAIGDTPPAIVAPPEIHLKKGIAQKPAKQTVKNDKNEVFHDIYGDVIESKNNPAKNPAPK